MAGLEKIIEEIRAESRNVRDAILQKADDEIKALRAEKEKEIAEKVGEILKKSRMEAADIGKRARSSAELLHRQEMLSAKQEMIQEMIASARASILQLPDQEYFALVKKLVLRNARAGKGRIFFNKKDKERLPKAFLPEIAGELPEGGTLRLGEETADISGGCILRYGGIEENCSIDAIFHEKKEQLQDLVRGILF